MATFKLTLEYDGTDFAGWQTQAPGQRTVQATLEAALAPLAVAAQAAEEGRVRVVGAGRTDAGVHAEGQVASVSLETGLSAGELRRAVNAHLPRDVAVLRVETAPEGFHARFDARVKVYRYEVWNAPVRSPLRGRRSHHVREALDLAAMAQAGELLIGVHDFACFQAAGSGVVDTVRRVHRLSVRGGPGGLICFDVAGNGFLRHMVRNLVGTLLEVGRGRRPAGSMPELLASRERAAAGPTAPARGLTLVRVDY
jgi:tRNA pseudouridine38-40 synthase